MYLAKLLTQCDHQVINRQHLPPLLRTISKERGLAASKNNAQKKGTTLSTQLCFYVNAQEIEKSSGPILPTRQNSTNTELGQSYCDDAQGSAHSFSKRNVGGAKRSRLDHVITDWNEGQDARSIQ